MGVQASAVDVIFKVTPIDATLRQFTINLWPAYFSALSDYAVNGSTILLDQQLPCNFVAKTEISIVESNGEITNTSVLLHDPKYAIPVATYTLQPTEDSLSVHLRISVLNTPETGGQSVTVYSAYSLLKDLKIDYLFINKERTNEYNRFLNDSLHFSAVFENQKIAIFQVL
jgi:hypothetical protein